MADNIASSSMAAHAHNTQNSSSGLWSFQNNHQQTSVSQSGGYNNNNNPNNMNPYQNFNYQSYNGGGFYNNNNNGNGNGMYGNMMQQQPPLPNSPPMETDFTSDTPPLPPGPPPPAFPSPGNLMQRPPFFSHSLQQQQLDKSNSNTETQFTGIRFNLSTQPKRLSANNPFANPLALAPPLPPTAKQQQQQQQFQNQQPNHMNNQHVVAIGKKKRNKRNKQLKNQMNTGMLNTQEPMFHDMSIPPPTLSVTIAATTPDLSRPPPPLPPSFHPIPQQSMNNQLTQEQQAHFHQHNVNQTNNQVATSKKPDPFNNPTDTWPESLNNYVARCYAKCQTDFDKDQIDICLKGRITAAANRGELWTKDWDEEPIPSVHSERNNAAILIPNKAPVAGSLSQFQKSTNGPQKPQLSSQNIHSPSVTTPQSKKGISQTLGARLGNRSNAKRSHSRSRSRSRSPRSSRKRRSNSSRSSSSSPRRKSSRRSSSSSTDDFIPLKSSSKATKTHEKYSNNKKNKKNKNNTNKKAVPFFSEHSMIGGDVEGDKERLQQRAARFSATGKKQITSVASSFTTKVTKKQRRAMLNAQRLYIDDAADGNFDLIDFHIVGTCRDLEKSFLRLTKAPTPCEVRPTDVLVFSLDNVKRRWVEKQDYFYACDQLKSIRQDLTVSL